MKTDGFPTYHFANVVDDRLMDITHVIRGSEWLPSTPKHVQLYNAFGWRTPTWIHLPLITRDGIKKLSKRDADAFVDYYDEVNGYLPLAVLNFLIRNGSGIVKYDKTHLYTLQEMVENFDEKSLTTRSFMVDINSLNDYGSMAFQKASFADDLLPEIKRRLGSIDEDLLSPSYLERVVAFLKSNEEGFSKLMDLTTPGSPFHFFFCRPKSAEKILNKYNAEEVRSAMQPLLRLEKFDVGICKKVAEAVQMPYPKYMQLLRLALIDNYSGPPLTELFDFFSTDECRQRFSNVLVMLPE
jgi:glutamyl-tRNA synthetase